MKRSLEPDEVVARVGRDGSSYLPQRSSFSLSDWSINDVQKLDWWHEPIYLVIARCYILSIIFVTLCNAIQRNFAVNFLMIIINEFPLAGRRVNSRLPSLTSSRRTVSWTHSVKRFVSRAKYLLEAASPEHFTLSMTLIISLEIRNGSTIIIPTSPLLFTQCFSGCWRPSQGR